jgi:hypothetical protein
VVILLVAINGYYEWLLVAIISMVIGGYSINGH